MEAVVPNAHGSGCANNCSGCHSQEPEELDR